MVLCNGGEGVSGLTPFLRHLERYFDCIVIITKCTHAFKCPIDYIYRYEQGRI